jgi:hypothetical protein
MADVIENDPTGGPTSASALATAERGPPMGCSDLAAGNQVATSLDQFVRRWEGMKVKISNG